MNVVVNGLSRKTTAGSPLRSEVVNTVRYVFLNIFYSVTKVLRHSVTFLLQMNGLPHSELARAEENVNFILHSSLYVLHFFANGSIEED